jgi:ribulose-bisphosphate carboxylase large chain
MRGLEDSLVAEVIRATYLVETPLTAEAAAAAIAGEQSSGTFLKLAGETPDLVVRHGAAVEACETVGEVETPSLPGAKPSPTGRYTRARVTVAWPAHNVGPSLPNLLATVAGNLSELGELSGLRLVDVILPDSIYGAYPGPRHGIQGTRDLTGVTGRPLIGTIIKPSVGLSPSDTAELVARLAEGGLDFIKDDELIASPPYSPLEARVSAVMSVLNDFAERTGKRVMYAFNITGDLDEMRRRVEVVVKAGGTSAMVSLNWIGPVALAALRRDCPLAIHGHRNGWGMLSRAPMLGLDFKVFQRVCRLAGADHIHVNGLANKFSEADESVIASARACLAPERRDDPRIMPVFSSGQTVLQAHPTYEAIGTTDLIFAAGGGIMGHPDGIAAGCRALKDAWEAAMAGIPLENAARESPPLARAIATFAGKVRRKDR